MKHAYLLCLLVGFLLVGRQPLPAQTPPAGFVSTTVSSQWNEVVGMAFNNAGTQMFVWERPGKVWVVENGQRQLLLDISEEVGGWNDHGLLGFALHPQFDTNGYFYLLYLVDRHHLINYGTPAYSPTANDYFSATIGRLTRYTATRTTGGYTVNPASRTILIGGTKTTGIPSTDRSHVTGSLVFGADGTLLVSTGDGAYGGDTDFGSYGATSYAQALADGIILPRENVGSFRAQMVTCLSGKILRIDPISGAGLPSNPFYDAAAPSSPKSRVWALGLRNPFRMSLKPGTGSSDPTAGNPGTLYIGDVGYRTWEEISVVSRKGQNLGWPLFEGLTEHAPFMNHPTANQEAPNPLYNTGGCNQPYFDFQDLIKQATPTGTATFPNPCKKARTIPSSIPTFVHTRPLIDWGHTEGPSRTGIFSGSTATTINIGAAGSPVSGPQFGGSASVGGFFYPYSNFPGYQNTYFFGDYVSGWMRNLSVDGTDKPTAVRDFVNAGAVVVGMAVHPTEQALYYANFPDEIRKITYGATSNRPPTAVATADKRYGPAPLSVAFRGDASADPDGTALSYLWNFGDGTSSTQQNPSHVFSPSTSAPTSYTITLTVTDTQGATGQATLAVSVNNTPPQVTITSPANNTLYPLTSPTTYNLRATVTDAEHSASQLSYAWQTFLHHETHEHPEPIDTAPQTTTTIEPLGCGAETYYYRIELTVTDAGGLSTKQEVRLNPDCSTVPAYTFYRAVNLNGGALTLDGNAWAGSTAANYTTNGSTWSNQSVTLIPATDATRASMIRDMVYRAGSLTASFTAVPAGSYQAYVYVWEDNNPEVFSLAVNGQTVLSNYNSGPAGTWARLGPYPVTLSATGAVQFTATGGTANFSGIELWQQGGTAPANQAPVLATIGNRSAVVGQPLTFTASATDPDAGQSLTYSLTGTVPAGAGINAATGAFSWTPTATGSFPVTVRVSDNGAPVLTDEETFTVTVTSAPPTGTYTFYRAINMNGSAITLDGNAWAGSTAPNYSYVGTPLSTPSVTLVPATDATRAAMIRSFVYNYPGSVSVTLTAIPAGNYQVYAYVFEDNNAEVYSLLLNGQTVVSNRNSGPAGTWARLGPWSVAINSGQVQLASSGGTANISGIELWQQSTANRGGQSPEANTVARQVTPLPELLPQLYPNPSPDGHFSLVLPQAFPEEVSYTLVSSLGATLATGKLVRQQDASIIPLDLSKHLQASGVYYLHLACPSRQLHLKLLRE